MLHPGQAPGDPREVVLPRPLLCQGEGAVVRGHGVDLAAAQGLPQRLLVRPLPQGRRADKPGRLQIVRVVVDAVLQQQVVGAGLHVHPLPPPPGGADLLQGLPGGEMDDDHRHVRQLRHAQQMPHRLGLQRRGPGAGVGGGSRAPARPGVLHQGADDPVVLTVDPGDAPGLLQPQKGPVHVPLADHHGRVGHVHLEG